MSPKLKLILFALLACTLQMKGATEEIPVTVGTGTSINPKAGFCEYWKYYCSKTIYLAEDIKKAGTIKKIAFQVNSAPSTVSSKVRIYMGTTKSNSISNTDEYNSSNLELVFSSDAYTLGVTSDGWQEITFPTGYNYDGENNLVVAVCTSKSSTPQVKYYHSTIEGRSVNYASDYTPDVFNIDGTTTLAANSIIPNTRFTFEVNSCSGSHAGCSTYSSKGFGICDNCKQILTNVYEEAEWVPTSASTGYGYLKCKNLGNLMWYADQQNTGKFMYNYQLQLTADITIDPATWEAIGNESHPFNGSIHGPYNINGLNADQYLIGVMNSNGYVQNIRMNNGAFVNVANGGKIRYSFTEGAKLANSGSFTNKESFCMDGSNATQLANGEITYKLNYYGSNSNWYQTIGTDNLPTLDNTHSKVYRYTKCDKFEYTNDEAKSGTTIKHNLSNGHCSYCGDPTTINQDVTILDYKSYTRSVNAEVYGNLTYIREFAKADINVWTSFYIPVAFEYTQTLYDNWFDIAKISEYRNDSLIITKLGIGETAEANTPYLIRPKRSGSFTITSNNGILYKASNDNVVISTTEDKFTFNGSYSTKTNMNSDGLMYTSSGNLTYVASDAVSLNPFRWTCKPTHLSINGCTIPTSITISTQPYVLNDNGSNSYVQQYPVIADNLKYKRVINENWVNKWQPMYLPFDLVITDRLISLANYAVFQDVTTQGEVEVFVIEKKEVGEVIAANTPFVIRAKQTGTMELSYTKTKLYSSTSNSVQLSSSNAEYTFTGVYEPYSSSNSWYGISRSDGLFHPASATATLAPYRFYLTINTSGAASDLRFAFGEIQEDGTTAITMVQKDNVEKTSTTIYSIEGRRLEGKLQPGLYIKNGKKIMIRK